MGCCRHARPQLLLCAPTSWPGLSRPSRFMRHGCALLSGITGTSPVMTDWQGLSAVMPAHSRPKDGVLCTPMSRASTSSQPRSKKDVDGKNLCAPTSWPGTAVAMHSYVITGLVPVIPLSGAQPCLMNRDARDKRGHDGGEFLLGFLRSLLACSPSTGHDGGKTYAFFVMAGLVPAIHVFTLCAVHDE